MIIRVSSGKMMLAQHLAKRAGKHPTKPHGEELSCTSTYCGGWETLALRMEMGSPKSLKEYS